MTYVPPFYDTLDSDPGQHGLTFLAEVGCEGMSYEYDFTRAWVDAAGAVYLAHTSGCSCGAPFDEFGSLADLIPVDTGTLPWLSALKAGDAARPYGVSEERWGGFVLQLRGQLMSSSNKRFDREAYEAAKAKEAEEAERQAMWDRLSKTHDTVKKVAERTGLDEMVARNFSEWTSYGKAALEYIQAADELNVEQVLLIGATLHAMAFGQIEQATQGKSDA